MEERARRSFSLRSCSLFYSDSSVNELSISDAVFEVWREGLVVVDF